MSKNIRDYINRTAVVGNVSGYEPELFDSIKKYIRNIVQSNIANYLGNSGSVETLDVNELIQDVLDVLASKKVINDSESNIPPVVFRAIQDVLSEIKTDPKFSRPKLQKTTLVYPKDIWAWLNSYGGSNEKIPDDFLSIANRNKWNTVYEIWQIKQSMKQWIKENKNNKAAKVPVQYLSTQTNPILDSIGVVGGYNGLFEQAKQEVSFSNSNSVNNNDMVIGASSEELAQTFIESYPDYVQNMIEEFDASVNPFDLIRDYAFRSETGGKSKSKLETDRRTRTFKDMRLNFFWEYKDFIPSHIAENMPMNEKEAFPYLNNNAQELTDILIDLMSQQSPEVQEYVDRKLSNKTEFGPNGKKRIRGHEQFKVNDEGVEMDFADQRNNSGSKAVKDVEREKSENPELISAVSSAFKRLANQMRSLASDVVSYMRRKKDKGRSTDKRAAFIDGMVNAGMDQIEASIDPNNKDALKNIKKMGLQINKDLQIDIQNIKWSKLISMEHGGRIVQEVNKSALEQGQPPLFQVMPSIEDFKQNPIPLLQFSLKKISKAQSDRFYSEFNALFSQDNASGLVYPDVKTNNPSYNEQLTRFYEESLSDYYKRVYVTGELAIDEIGQYLMYLGSQGKYSKDILISFLSLLRTHTGVRQGKYPGGRADHPSVGAYKNINEGKFNSFQHNPDFESQIHANIEMKYSLIKTAISNICDLVYVKQNTMSKHADSVSYIDDMIEQVIVNTVYSLNKIVL